MVSVYSVFSAMVFYNLGLLAVYILMRKTRFVINYTAASLSLLTLLATIRLFVPADLSGAFIIRSSKIIPAVRNFLSHNVFSDSLTVGGTLIGIWALGTLGYLARDTFLISAAKRAERNFRLVKNEQVIKAAEELGLRCRIKVSPDIKEPYSAGILRPTIYLPDWDLEEQELKTVLRHEYAHIRSFDAVKKLVFVLLEALFWWNPISHIFRREFNQLLEIQCDFKLTKDKNEKARLQYAETLFSVMKRISSPKKDRLYSCAMSNSVSNMKQRFELILDSRKAEVRFTKALLYIALIFVFGLSYFVIAQPYYAPELSDIDGLYFVDEDNSFILKDGEDYTIYHDGEMLYTMTESELSRSNAYSDLPIIENTN